MFGDKFGVELVDEAGICPGNYWVFVALENENLRSCQNFSPPNLHLVSRHILGWVNRATRRQVPRGRHYPINLSPRWKEMVLT